MRVVKDSVMHVGWVSWAIEPPAMSLILVAKATFQLVPNAPAELVPEDDQELPTGAMFWDEDPERPIRYASDLAVIKPRAEVMLTGTWRSPGFEPVPHSVLSFECGTVKKQLALIGDRHWEGGMAGGVTDPQPFTEMQLSWERSLGGPGNRKNPAGRGLTPDPSDPEGRVPLPNIEDPANLVTSQSSSHPPAGAFPIPLTWPARMRFVGTYDGSWMRDRYPWFPADLQWDYFMAAPEDQQIPGFWRGDEPIKLVGLHPSFDKIESALPDISPKVFLHQKDDGKLREVGLVLDTLVIDADTGHVQAVWRGATPCQDQSLAEFEHVFLVHEPTQLRQTPGDYRAWFDRKLAEEAEEEGAHEAEEPNRSFEDAITAPRYAASSEDASREEDAEGEAVTNPRVVNAGPETAATQTMAQLQEEMAQQRLAALETQVATMREAGVPEETIESLLAGLRPMPPLSPEAQALADAEARTEQLQAMQAVRQAAQETGNEELIAQVEAMAQAIETEADDEPPPPSEPPAEEEPELIEIFRRAVREGQDLSEFVFSELSLQNEDLRGANLEGTAFVRCDFTGANLTQANLRGAVLNGCILDRVQFMGADLTQAELSESHGQDVCFDDAKLEQATAAEAKFPSGSFRGVAGHQLEFNECDLTAANFMGALLDEATFSGSLLDRANFLKARLVDARLDDGVSARGACFEQANLDQIRASEGSDFSQASFKWASINQGRFGGSVLDKANFSFANLIDADFTQSFLIEAVMLKCDLTQASFQFASMVGAQLGGSNLRQASLEAANLHHADLSHANLYEAELFQANVEDANFAGANLQQTKLAP